jgi:amidophosphoribosyltransferase
MDTEYIVRLLEQRQTGDFVKDLTGVLLMLRGSYALGILRPEMLIAVQGPHSNRPLCLGKRGESHFICSESCGFDNVDADFVRELKPGEILCITKDGLSSTFLPATAQKRCFFELNYFSHPASTVFGRSVEEHQLKLGAMLEKYCPTPGADIVVPVPDSAEMVATGYAASGNSGRYSKVIRRNHYVGRTFIQESQAKRDTAVANKFTFTPHQIAGKSIVIVDDSIVRGTTLRRIVKKLRHYGAKEVHLRIGTPPIAHPCRYGIDISTYKELVASRLNPQQIAEELGADSLMFFPLEAQKELLGDPQNFCFACVTGQYW